MPANFGSVGAEGVKGAIGKPLVASAEAKPSATTIRKHESEIKKGEKFAHEP